MSAASISPGEVLVLACVYGFILATAGVTVAKGHVALFVAGFLAPMLVWLIAALRLAKPNSPWARRFYGDEKLARSRRRYPAIDPTARSSAGIAAAIGFGLLGASFLVGLVAGIVSAG